MTCLCNNLVPFKILLLFVIRKKISFLNRRISVKSCSQGLIRASTCTFLSRHSSPKQPSIHSFSAAFLSPGEGRSRPIGGLRWRSTWISHHLIAGPKNPRLKHSETWSNNDNLNPNCGINDIMSGHDGKYMPLINGKVSNAEAQM